MQIKCSHCHKLFEPSPSQRETLNYPNSRHYCSHECKCEGQRAKPSPVVTNRPPAPDPGFHVHIEVPSRRVMRQLVRLLKDIDCELVSVRRRGSLRYALQMVVPPRKPGSPPSLIEMIGAAAAKLEKQTPPSSP